MVDFVERFFKLTLDNVYRFTCSLLFAVSLWGLSEAAGPLVQLTRLLDWLAVPSAWLLPVGRWVAEREDVVGGIATLTLIVAALFAVANGRRSRSGSTALLSIVILMQIGQGGLLLGLAVKYFLLFAGVTGVAAFVWIKVEGHAPIWTQVAWKKVGNVAATLGTAVAYLFSPLGWLISEDPYSQRGTRWDPIYFKQAGRS